MSSTSTAARCTVASGAALFVALFAFGGCGTVSYITLEVNGDNAAISIPDQLNRLELSVLSAADRSEVGSATLDLDSSHSFPMTILLEPSSDTPGELEVHLRGYLDAVLVARVDARHPWNPGVNNIARLPDLEWLN